MHVEASQGVAQLHGCRYLRYLRLAHGCQTHSGRQSGSGAKCGRFAISASEPCPSSRDGRLVHFLPVSRTVQNETTALPIWFQPNLHRCPRGNSNVLPSLCATASQSRAPMANARLSMLVSRFLRDHRGATTPMAAVVLSALIGAAALALTFNPKIPGLVSVTRAVTVGACPQRISRASTGKVDVKAHGTRCGGGWLNKVSATLWAIWAWAGCASRPPQSAR